MENIKLKKPLFLCGMMGSGKSTVGKILATALDVPFYDLDSMITEKAGMSIPQIFEQKGEEWFREVEQEIIFRESQTISGIMALGGGSLQNQQLVNHLKINGCLIFLSVPESLILKRIAGDQNRPKLNSAKGDRKKLKATISTLIKQRSPLYSQAQITIDADDSSPQKLAETILNKIKNNEGFNRG